MCVDVPLNFQRGASVGIREVVEGLQQRRSMASSLAWAAIPVLS